MYFAVNCLTSYFQVFDVQLTLSTLFWQSQDLKAFSIVPTLNIPTIYMSKLYKPPIHIGEHLTHTIARVILV